MARKRKNPLEGISQEHVLDVAKRAVPSPTVRTTVRISYEARKAMLSLKEQWKCTDRDFFETITYVVQSPNFRDLLPIVASASRSDAGIRVSISPSKRSLESIDEAARQATLKRDEIISYAITWLEAVRNIDQRKRLKWYKKAQSRIEDLAKLASEAESEIGNALNEDDPLRTRLSFLSINIDNLLFALEEALDEGKDLDPEG